MATLDSFRPMIQVELHACPTVTIDAAVIEACRAIANDTWLVRYDVTEYVFAGTPNYTVTAPSGHEVFAVKSIVLDGATVLTPCADSAAKRNIAVTGTPNQYWFVDGELWLYPTPDTSYTVVVDAVIRPLFTATTVDDKFVPLSDAVYAWALSKLKRMDGVLWVDSQGSVLNYRLYKQLVGARRTTRDTSGTVNVRRVVPHFF
jgi:hypothetical protein